MGWLCEYYGYCPDKQERLEKIANRYEFDGNVVVSKAIVGTTVYIAQRRTDGRIVGGATLTKYTRDGWFGWKDVGYEPKCPKRILDLLNTPDADEWRKICAEYNAKHKPDALSKLPIGAKVRRKDTGAVLVKYQYRQRKVYVDWMQSKYMTPAQLRQVGYEIIDQK